MQIHIVSTADTSYSIAARYNIPVSRLIYDNQLEIPDDLVTGQALLILEPEILYTTVSGDSIYCRRLWNIFKAAYTKQSISFGQCLYSARSADSNKL